MTTSKATNRTRVFVYGTLKRGHGNHEWYLADNPDAEYLGRCLIEGRYKMYSNGAFPMLTDGHDTSSEILGEVYDVGEETLLAMDLLEGHPDWYCRKKVTTPWKNAWVYTMPYSTEFHESTLVPSGCFNMSASEAQFITEQKREQAEV